MSKLMKKAAVILMAFVVTMSMMPVMGSLTDGAIGAQTVFAETYENVQPEPPDGFVYTIYAEEGGASIWVTGYVGTNTQVILPTSVTYNGVTYNAWDSAHNTQGNGAFIVGSTTFAGNTEITKIAIPYGYEGLADGAFKGCTNLTEVAIADTVIYIANDVFDDCDSLTTYYYSGDQLAEAGEDEAVRMIINSGLGQDENGKPIGGVTVYTKPGSVVEKAVEEINQKADDPEDPAQTITIETSEDPYSEITVEPEDGGPDGPDEPVIDPGPSQPESGSKTKKQMGKDGTAYGKGASEATVDKAITKYGKEKDPKGTKFGLLKAKLSKTTNKSITLKWSKVKGAKKYVIYANACSLKKPVKLVKHKTINVKKKTKCKWVCKQINKKKLKKGTYYKFVVVALDKKGNVISTSKIVHAATKGGKAGNDKAVKTNAKKKITIKKGKKFKLKAKAVPQNKKKKLYRHRGIAYESSNPKVATVSSKGVIKGKKKGTCYVYAYAQNGVFKKIKVTVKK